MRAIAAMRALLLCACAAFDYKSISVNAPRRIVTQDDIDAKFEEVDKPYAFYPVDGPAEEGLCVLAEISLSSPGFEWKRDNYISAVAELLGPARLREPPAEQREVRVARGLRAGLEQPRRHRLPPGGALAGPRIVKSCRENEKNIVGRILRTSK